MFDQFDKKFILLVLIDCTVTSSSNVFGHSCNSVTVFFYRKLLLMKLGALCELTNTTGSSTGKVRAK